MLLVSMSQLKTVKGHSDTHPTTALETPPQKLKSATNLVVVIWAWSLNKNWSLKSNSKWDSIEKHYNVLSDDLELCLRENWSQYPWWSHYVPKTLRILYHLEDIEMHLHALSLSIYSVNPKKWKSCQPFQWKTEKIYWR